MVIPSGRRSRRGGATRKGCLVWLLVVAVVAYYGAPVGGAYFKYWRIKEEMQSQARLAPSIDDATIRRRLLRTMDGLELPDEARRKLIVRRLARPREIRIRTEYQVPLTLPFIQYTLTLSPEARQPL